jgi:hypothetical protein
VVLAKVVCLCQHGIHCGHAYNGPSGCVTIGRTRYYTCVHLAILCICDTRALDAPDRDALMARSTCYLWDSIALYLYDTRRVCALFVRYALCYALCTRRAVRDDIL